MRIPGLIIHSCSVSAVALILCGCAGWKGIRHAEESGETILRGLQWPVAGVVSSGFGGRGGRHHGGVDILAPSGTEVLAAGDGTVVYAGNSLRGYGNAAVLDHGHGITTLYGHLMKICVKSGDAVRKGTVIGAVGRTGNATTDHLHFEIRADGKSVDPEIHMPGKGETQ